MSIFISRSLKGQQKSVLALGATQGVAYSRKVDFQSGYPRYHRLTKIHCPPGRYIETCSNDAKRRVHRNLHMNSGPLPEATPCVQTWSAKVHVYSCVSQLINRNRQPYKQTTKSYLLLVKLFDQVSGTDNWLRNFMPVTAKHAHVAEALANFFGLWIIDAVKLIDHG